MGYYIGSENGTNAKALVFLYRVDASCNGKIDLTWSKTEDLEKHICTECRVKEDSEFARLVAENNP